MVAQRAVTFCLSRLPNGCVAASNRDGSLLFRGLQAAAVAATALPPEAGFTIAGQSAHSFFGNM